ncbi:MAG: hypothetical protein QOI10_1107 [Solirubrobacterales bacterium]|nr:hypothetical protein [Solirubrobacterales bacterium]
MTDIPKDFKRSSRFGVIGVGVVMVLTAAIALLFGSNSANPTGVLIVIFVLVFGFVGVLLYLQRRDVDSAEARSKQAALAATEPVTDPTTADQMSLLADLATGPVDRAAIAAASGRTWTIARKSIGSGATMMVLIACAVIPFELSHELWSIVVFVPAIIVYAVYLAARVLMPGGTLDLAYDDAGTTATALGLSESERPKVKIRSRPFGQQGLEHEMEGAIAYTGERHGRTVSIRIDATAVTTELSGAVSGFEVKARDERLRADAQSPPPVAAVIEPLRASSYWKGVVVRGGNHGVTVERTGSGAGQHWIRDLWLAEHLADAAKR